MYFNKFRILRQFHLDSTNPAVFPKYVYFNRFLPSQVQNSEIDPKMFDAMMSNFDGSGIVYQVIRRFHAGRTNWVYNTSQNFAGKFLLLYINIP